MKRAAAAVLLGAALCVGCAGRWLPPKTYEVPTQADQRASYAAVLELVASKGYTVLNKDDAAAKARLQAKANGANDYDAYFTYVSAKPIPPGSWFWLHLDGDRLALASQGSMYPHGHRPRLPIQHGHDGYRTSTRSSSSQPMPAVQNPPMPKR